MKRDACDIDGPSGLARVYGSLRGAQQVQEDSITGKSPWNSNHPRDYSLLLEPYRTNMNQLMYCFVL